MPVALPERVGEAAVDRPRGVDADEVEALRRVENGRDDAFGRGQRIAADDPARMDIGRIMQVRIVGQVRHQGAQRRERMQQRLAVARQIAANRHAMLGVLATDDQVQPYIALLDRSRLADLALVHAHEIGHLGIERAGVNLAREKRAVEKGGELVEIGFHRRDRHQLSPPKTSTPVNTQAGDACPTRITCDGSPLPQYGVPSTSHGRGVADPREAAPEVGRDAAIVGVLDDGA